MTQFCGARRRQQPPDADRVVTCHKPAGWGTGQGAHGIGYCRLHTGNTPTSRRHAASLHAERNAARALEQLRSGPVIPTANVDPGQALRGMLHESAVLLAYLRGEVEKLPGWVGDKMAATSRGDLYETSEEERALVRLYNDAIDRTAKLAKTCLDAGVDAAMVRLQEDQGARLNAAFRLYMQRMGFDPDMADRSRREFANAFRELTPVAAGTS